jgi:sulfide dehydrogenase [flavocytochrome c] flavoprotein chain
MAFDRRAFLTGAGAATLIAPSLVRGQQAAKVVVVGGGFAGASCARTLKKLNGALGVTLVERDRIYTACPFNSAVIAGLRPLERQRFGYEALTRQGITVATAQVTAVDPAAGTVTLSTGDRLNYDRLVVAPGIDINWQALPGYNEAAAEKMPHAWKGGGQVELLHRQLEAMADGGLVVISAPATPYRCPPAPYERAGLIAHYLKAHKPRSKIILLDSKDSFSKQRLFQDAWKALYPGMIEWIPLSQGGNVTSVDPATLTFITDFDKYKADVANVVPPQKGGVIATIAGVADRTSWCPIDPVSFESTLQRGVYVLGDAALAGAMPKSASSAAAQGAACAASIVARLAGRDPPQPHPANLCYSLASPDYGFSERGVYHPENGLLLADPGTNVLSPVDGDAALRLKEAHDAEDWYRTITTETFG